jgi:antirestriction protein
MAKGDLVQGRFTKHFKKGGKIKYYLNGFEESIKYILDSTDAVEVGREGSLEEGNLVIYFETIDNKKFKKGGATEKYSYIPQKNIKALTTTYGNTIKGKDLLDGAYTTRKDIRQDPKMVRTIFEEEYFEEFGKGGLTKQQKDYLRKLGISEAEIKEADKREKAGRMSAINPKAPVTYYEGKLYENGGAVDKFALGDVISSDDTPKVWVGEWSLYNEGRLIGEWIDLSNFDSGAEVMAYIQSLLDKWTKETGELREEYAIFDYENFPSNLYSEGMGEGSFDKVIRAYKFSVENDVPMEVVGEIISEYDIDDLEEWFSERYAGQFDSDTDLAYWYVDEMLGGVENLDKKTQEMYFDYEAFGRDLAINDYRDINGYYFQTYRKGGMTMKNLNLYYKTK